MKRRDFLKLTALGSPPLLLGSSSIAAESVRRAYASSAPGRKPFELEEVTIAELQAVMKSGQGNRRLVRQKVFETN